MEIQQDNNFTLAHYSNSLDEAIRNDYIFLPMKSVNAASGHNRAVILRHDIDTQLDTALKMAKIEYSKNIRSTYFIRFHSHAYNPLCFKDANKIRELTYMGHEVGLHYEPDYYSLLKMDFKKFFLHELDILSSLVGEQVVSVAPHEPTRTKVFKLEEEIASVSGIKFEAYNSVFLEGFKYISDSSCRWRDGSLYYHVKNANHEKLYVLTHPYWWYNDSPIENY